MQEIKKFLNSLVTDLRTYYGENKEDLINDLSDLKILTNEQYHLKYIKTIDKNVYDFIIANFFKTSKPGWIEALLLTKVRKTYESFKDIEIEDGSLDFTIRYDENVIFKPTNKMVFDEFKRSASDYWTFATNLEAYAKAVEKGITVDYQFTYSILNPIISKIQAKVKTGDLKGQFENFKTKEAQLEEFSKQMELMLDELLKSWC